MSAAERQSDAALTGPQLVSHQPVAPERRRSERRPQHAEGWLSSPGGRSFTTGRRIVVIDLSLHGVGFASDHPCETGERHWVLIHRGPMRFSSRIRIASCRPAEDGQYTIGGEFY